MNTRVAKLANRGAVSMPSIGTSRGRIFATIACSSTSTAAVACDYRRHRPPASTLASRGERISNIIGE